MASVLVVDDALFMRILLKNILEKSGHRVTGEGGTGEEAVQLYLDLKPDLVILDVVMPQKSGLDAVKEILALDPLARIIMVSAVGQQATTEAAVRAGARAFILKPFQPERVRACVREVLSLPSSGKAEAEE
ncbi:MAG: response regulator [Nitrospinae bacterium]|nr:response regulator [Nitrospinota bacterium]